MNRVYIILLFFIISFLAEAQTGFYDLYEGWKINKVFSFENRYISIGSIVHPSTDGYLPCFNLIDADGNIIESYYYINDTLEGMNTYKSLSYILRNDTLLFVSTYTDYNKNYYLSPLLIRFDLTSKEVDTIINYHNCFNNQAINYLLDTVENGLVITGTYIYSTDNYFPMVIFTDPEGVATDTKTYDFLPVDPIRRGIWPYQLLKLHDGGFLLSCQDEIGYPYNGIYPKVRSWFVRLDSGGNELWRRTTASQDTLCFHPFAARMEDGDYLMLWSDPYLYDDDLTPLTNYNMSLWMARMTDNGVIYGKKKLSHDIEGFPAKNFAINDLYQDSSGNVFVAGALTYTNPRSGFLIKINKNSVAEWFREIICFPENDAELQSTIFYGLTPTLDGGFIIGGEYQCSDGTLFPGGIQKGLAIKVDSCGCLEENCNPLCNVSIGQQFITAQNAVIYPNPTTDFINIELSTYAKSVNIKVYDTEGCLWINAVENGELSNPEKLSLDISGLAAGFYTVNIWADGKFFKGNYVKVGE